MSIPFSVWGAVSRPPAIFVPPQNRVLYETFISVIWVSLSEPYTCELALLSSLQNEFKIK